MSRPSTDSFDHGSTIDLESKTNQGDSIMKKRDSMEDMVDAVLQHVQSTTVTSKQEASLESQVSSLNGVLSNQIQVLAKSKKTASWKRRARDKFSFDHTNVSPKSEGQ